jgi:3-hydroxybutyryl-CoA dehydrogenase
MQAESIAIVGPGRMGVGIATAVLMANQGHTVTLVDTKKRDPGKQTEALDRASAEIKANLALLDELELLRGDAAALDASLNVSTELTSCVSGCSFIFEALPEKVPVKQKFYRAVGPLMSDDTVIASATSTFHLDVFWEVCTRPGNVVCAHWLNPAFLIPLVEVAGGEKTHALAAAGMSEFLRRIGKIPVNMKTSPGFIVPRIQAAAMNEAIRILQEGIAGAQEIDTAIKAGFGFRLGVMGLIEFVDLGGVDILFHAGEYLHGKLGQDQFEPPRLVREKMAADEVGPRTGKGFYDYKDVDVRKLFNLKYQGFAELLRLYERSEFLNFAGGITVDGTPAMESVKATGKEKP